MFSAFLEFLVCFRVLSCVSFFIFSSVFHFVFMFFLFVIVFMFKICLSLFFMILMCFSLFLFVFLNSFIHNILKNAERMTKNTRAPARKTKRKIKLFF